MDMETNSNPWGIGFSKRAEWGETLAVRHIKDVPDAEYLFWVGCMGAFDDAGKGIAGSLVKILRAAGIGFGTLGTEESLGTRINHLRTDEVIASSAG